MLKWPYESPRRGAPTPERHFGEFDGCIGGWYDRGRALHRRARPAVALVPRPHARRPHEPLGPHLAPLGPGDFRRQQRDGLGDDWPIAYDDIKPVYDRLDQLVGIFGTNFAAERKLTNEPDGIFMPPPEAALLRARDPGGVREARHPVRSLAAVDPDAARSTAAPPATTAGSAAAAAPRTPTSRPPSVLLPPALATGRLTIVTGAMAREVTTDAAGKATGVSYIDKATGSDHHVRARIVVLAASTCESARIMLNSRSARHPQRLPNSSGALGRYLTDSTGLSVAGFVPKLTDTAAAQRGRRRRHAPLHAVVGSTTGRSTSRADTTSRSAADAACRATASAAASSAARRAAATARRSRTTTDATTAPRSTSPAAARWCRTPAPTARSIRRSWTAGASPSCASTSSGATTSAAQAKHMQDTFRSHHRPGWAARRSADRMPGAEQGPDGSRCGRPNHPRGAAPRAWARAPERSVLNEWCQAHEAKNVFVGRRRARSCRRPTRTHLDDHGARDAHERAHRRRAEEGEPLSHQWRIVRRSQGGLKTLGAVPVAAGFAWTAAEAAAGAPARNDGTRGRHGVEEAVRAEVLHRAR